MIADLFNAIENRFNGSQQCKEYCRKLFKGYDESTIKEVLPQCLVNITQGGVSGNEDTIGVDGESCHIQFEVRTKRDIPDLADRAFEAIRYTFDKADMSYGEHVTCQMNRISWDGPKFVNADLDGNKLSFTRSTLIYLCEFQRHNMSPATRDA